MIDHDEIDDFRIAEDLPELDASELERLRRDRSIVLWPLAVEDPEDEGDIPSELQPSRSRPFGRWEEIVAIPEAPLGPGDTFSTRVRDGQRRATSVTSTYRVHGRLSDSRHDWLVVEWLSIDRPLDPRSHERPPLRVRYDDDPAEDQLIAVVGDSRWRLGVDAKSGRHVAKATSGGGTERHGYSRDEITRALVDAHLLWDQPLPDIRAVQQQHWKRTGERYQERLRSFEWTLSQQGGVRITKGTVQAVSFRHALELATRDAFGEEPREPPAIDDGTRRVWTHFRSTKELEVRRVG